ncbi:MAG: universal stress protein UspE [Ferrimonas sp.]
MSQYQHILVVIEPNRDHQPALVHAKAMADRCGSKLTLFMTVYEASYEMTSLLSSQDRELLRQQLTAQRQQQIDALADPLRQQGIEVDTKLCYHHHAFESIIQFAMKAPCQLILKSTEEQERKLRSVLFTPVDWSLMRKAPMPVLLVKQATWPEGGIILVGVDVGTEDESHRELNQRLIWRANNLAALTKAQVHLVNGYPSTPVNIAIELPDFDAQAYTNSLHEYHQLQMTQLAQQHNIPAEQCHVLEGLPEDVIPELAQRLKADLIVIGTIGRTGLSAALLGNTAEHIIGAIDCDLLAEKPLGFVSPIQI